MRDQYRAAIPDPKNKSLVLSLNGQRGIFTTQYLVYVMHHELNHCTEFAIWKSMIHRWSKWSKLNAKNFKYQKGGSIAYKPQKNQINWLGSTHPHEGFINLYATTGQEEDRSELFAMLMTDQGCVDILKYYSNDVILRNKLDLLVSTLNKLCGSNENYWTSQLTEISSHKN